ncbi:hypothetical protein GCM10023185_21060 [Hymenobacter saemangeumensis]|uniref:Tetratricopeptide repeat protein n=1 Tax=Hymenobacter saemangeumensis TaxID=1084522 RepID=A0ABP8IDS0_9BACT
MLGAQGFAQSPKEQALAKGLEAIKLMDNGKIPESIKLLEEARVLDPNRYDYPYELAYAHYSQEEYKVAISLLEPLLRHKSCSDKTFQLLGNSYDMTGDAKKAIATYEAGLHKFPASGPLHLEMGNMEMGQERYQPALEYYEKGIELAPQFPSNYYWAAKLYLSSSAKMWGLMYGELFMNLERNSKRTAEMSKLLYDTYKSGITFPSDSSVSVNFSSHVMSIGDFGKGKKFKMPYSITYGTTMALAVSQQRAVNLRTLNLIRSNFISHYYQLKNEEKHPRNILFDYQQQMAQAGHAEAYNYWLLMKGEEDSFIKWRTVSQGQWDKFVEWYSANPLPVDARHKFVRSQF